MRTPLIALLAACAGCANQGPLTLAPSGTITADDYESVLDAWTRSDKVYDILESKLFVYATFHSPAFRRAFVLRHTAVYGKGAEEAQRLIVTKPEYEEHLEFFFSAYTPDRAANDFDQEDSIWRVTLRGDDGEPVIGEVVKITPTSNIRVIYPYITAFSKTYAVRFSRTTEEGAPVLTSATTQFEVRMVSAIGEAVLTWDLEPTADRPPL